MRSFAYVLPDTIEQASEQAKLKGAVLKAGGIDLLDLMKGDIIAPERLVNLSHIKIPGHARDRASRTTACTWGPW